MAPEPPCAGVECRTEPAEIATVIIASLIFWTVLQEVIRLFVGPYLLPGFMKSLANDNARREAENRIVSSCHASIVAVGCAYALDLFGLFHPSGPVIAGTGAPHATHFVVIGYGSVFSSDPIFGHSLHSYLWTMIAVGYFLMDLLTMIRYPALYSHGMLAHHVLGSFSFPIVVYYRHLELVVVLFVMTEATTPFINLHWIFSALNRRSGWLYLVNGFCMFFGFWIIRLPMTPYVLMTMSSNWQGFLQVSPLVKVLFVIAVTGISVLNIFWSYLIAKGLLKAVMSATRPEPKVIELKKKI
eukprot:gnl/Spiro4/14809_TR7983_c0_g1_i1.p1 gnl/Spiro4/14809_TR7983_c0_g1~~gnl/Spiro4/14809_TR7983_c0_g1_i1.p1  ORF type:complete len:299 (-),score=25.14 gnl/Spiro4/14809_TR7983_c0_g1_i1:115-1011(-)